MRARLTVAGSLLLIGGLGVGASVPPPATLTGAVSLASTGQASPPTAAWMIGSNAVALLDRTPGGPAVVSRLDNGRTYDLAGRSDGGGTGGLPHAMQTQVFTSYADMQQAFRSGGIQAATTAIVYDAEAWQFTPVAEQRDPVYYARLAAALVHGRRLQFIATPAINLATTTSGQDRYDAYLRSSIWQAAAYTDVFEIQAQQLEGTPRFAAFVSQVVSQIHGRYPSAVVFAGMSTNPLGRPVPAQAMVNDLRATRSTVNGYWLNIPQASPYCPACGQARPDIAVQFLNQVL